MNNILYIVEVILVIVLCVLFLGKYIGTANKRIGLVAYIIATLYALYYLISAPLEYFDIMTFNHNGVHVFISVLIYVVTAAMFVIISNKIHNSSTVTNKSNNDELVFEDGGKSAVVDELDAVFESL